MWNIFHPKRQPLQKVITGRFEIEQSELVAYLEYSLAGNILELIHTEVPEKLRHLGIAFALAENALQWAREHNLKVDIICPTVRRYVKEHPEYSDLEMHSDERYVNSYVIEIVPIRMRGDGEQVNAKKHGREVVGEPQGSQVERSNGD